MENISRFVLSIFLIFYKFQNFTKCVGISDINQSQNSKLLGIIEIVNHGASTPVSYYDEVKNVFYPNPSGVLTSKGSKQMKILGNYIKTKYFSAKNNLNAKNNNYIAMSLGMPRCINSAISHLQTVFPKDLVAFRNYQFINEDNDNPLSISRSSLANYFDFKEFVNRTEENNVQDVLLNFMNGKDDKLLSPRKCFKFNRTLLNNLENNFEENEKDMIIKSLNTTFPNLIVDLVSNDFNSEVMTNVFDFLNSVEHHYPNIFKPDEDLTKILAKYKIKHHYNYLNNDEDVKLLSSNLFEMFLTTFDNLVNFEKGNLRRIGNKNNYNSLFIFGDERNFIDIFNNLIDRDYITSLIETYSENKNAHNELLPPYASHLVLELYKYDENFYVKIIYNGEEIFTNPKKFKKLKDKTIYYDINNGMKFEEFKLLLLSRINEKYKTTECK